MIFKHGLIWKFSDGEATANLRHKDGWVATATLQDDLETWVWRTMGDGWTSGVAKSRAAAMRAAAEAFEKQRRPSGEEIAREAAEILRSSCPDVSPKKKERLLNKIRRFRLGIKTGREDR